MSTCRTLWVLFTFSLLGLTEAAAQFASIRGRVTDREDGQPLQGVHVLLDNRDGRRIGTATDKEGFYIISRIQPGAYVLAASFIGYEVYSDSLRVTFGETLTQNIELTLDETQMNEVVVESEREGGSQPLAGFEKIRPSALLRVPMPDVSADLMSYLLTMPGVVTAGDRGGHLFIRGGTPTQNLILIDGMRVYQPFHIVGFYSIFPASILSYADVYAGGFGARYGGRISSVIDVSTRNGNKNRVVGAVSIAPFLSSLLLEAPLVPGKMSAIVSLRESVIDHVAPNLLGTDLPYRFGDLFMKVHAYLNKTSSFSATMLRSFDEGNIADTEGDLQFSRWTNEAYGARYTYLPADEPVMTQFAVYGSRLDNRYSPTPDQHRRAITEGFNGDVSFAYLLGNQQIQFGIFVATTYFQYNIEGIGIDTESNVTEGGAFIEGKFNFRNRVNLEPGLRVQSFSNGIKAALEPRLRVQWLPRGPQGPQRISAAWGLYHQQIIGLNNIRDATDAFVAWAPSPPNTVVPRAMHLIGGWRQRLIPGLDLTLEGYYKKLENLSFPRFHETMRLFSGVEYVEGKVHGLDCRIEMNRPGFYGYIGYGLAQVKYERISLRSQTFLENGRFITRTVQDIEQFPPPQDRRHQLNLLGQYARGPYRLSIRWQYGSGLPFTKIHGYYDALAQVHPENSSFLTQSGISRVSFADTYAARLPSYHRLDVSLDRRFTFREWTLTAQAGVINVYNRSNIFNFDLLTKRRVDQLPLIPSVGLKMEFR